MKVLVGIDESEYSGAAIRFIGEASWPEATKFIVLSSCPPIFLGAGEAVSGEGLTEILAQEEARHREIAQRAAIRLRKAGLSVEARTVRASAPLALVDMARAEKMDLVIVGSHGRSGFKKLLLGSVASHVVTHAPCSVLVVKQPQLHGRALEPSDREPGREKAMRVEQLMTRDVGTCTPESNLAHAAMIMARRNCGFVPVVEYASRRLAGVITDRDICMAAAVRRDAHSIPVGEIMTSRLVTCAPTDEAEVAMHKMSEARVRRLPVVDKTGALKGVVSLTDLALVSGPSPLRTEGRGVKDADVLAVLKSVCEYPLSEKPVSVA